MSPWFSQECLKLKINFLLVLLPLRLPNCPINKSICHNSQIFLPWPCPSSLFFSFFFVLPALTLPSSSPHTQRSTSYSSIFPLTSTTPLLWQAKMVKKKTRPVYLTGVITSPLVSRFLSFSPYRKNEKFSSPYYLGYVALSSRVIWKNPCPITPNLSQVTVRCLDVWRVRHDKRTHTRQTFSRPHTDLINSTTNPRPDRRWVLYNPLFVHSFSFFSFICT